MSLPSARPPGALCFVEALSSTVYLASEYSLGCRSWPPRKRKKEQAGDAQERRRLSRTGPELIVSPKKGRVDRGFFFPPLAGRGCQTMTLLYSLSDCQPSDAQLFACDCWVVHFSPLLPALPLTKRGNCSACPGCTFFYFSSLSHSRARNANAVIEHGDEGPMGEREGA